jgi:hypothetical protein
MSREVCSSCSAPQSPSPQPSPALRERESVTVSPSHSSLTRDAMLSSPESD